MSRTLHRSPRAWCLSRSTAKRRRGLRHVFRPGVTRLEDRITPSGNLVISSAAKGFTSLSIPGPAEGVVLSNGNYVLINEAAPSVSLYNGKTGALISTLNGVGTVTPLTNGNFVAYNNNANSVTWCSGTTGLDGTVSAANSLILGGPPPDYLVVTPLTNGNYVVDWEGWNGGRGAVTWCDGTKPTTGTVSASNSLIGDLGDYVGGDEEGKGFGGGIKTLPDGNYLVGSPSWNNGAGAVTWGDGAKGVSGTVSADNSLVGSNPKDAVGWLSWGYYHIPGILILANGNYVVNDGPWDNSQGAVTWGNAATGVSGVISASNSLIGICGGDESAQENVVALTNGNYVVVAPGWNSGTGAVTWVDGTTGTIGTISAANSLIEVDASGVIALTNGNYVVNSVGWKGDVGAVTWCDGTKPTIGTVSAINSLVGSPRAPGHSDEVGSGGITALANGNYVVSSPNWNIQAGAVTWCDGTKPTVATISAGNSLVGSGRTGGYTDQVGGGTIFIDNQGVPIGGVTALSNGNYVVDSPNWGGNAGAATWGDGQTGTSGFVGSNNSLVGTYSGDFVGFHGVTALPNGNYVVDSPDWNNNMGAVTWADGSMGVTGMISDVNSLVGSTAGDRVGGSEMENANGQIYFYSGGVTALPNGNYVVLSPYWSGGGVATWADGTRGVVGAVSSANSLITGPTELSNGVFTLTVLSNSNYLVLNVQGGIDGYFFTWVDGTTGTTWDGQNTPDAQNSFYGGGFGVTPLFSGGGSFILTIGYNSGAPATSELVVTDPNDLTYGFAPDELITVSPDMLTRALDEGRAVTIQANNDITIDDPITADPTGKPSDLTLEAGRSILVDAGINTAGGNLSLIANDSVADGVIDGQRGPGDAEITMLSGVTLKAGPGTLSVDLKQSTDKTNNGSGAATLLGVTAGATTLSQATTLGISINGANPGDGIAPGTYTQVDVTGPINLNGAALQVTSNRAGGVGTTYTIVQSSGGVSGTFDGLPEGTRVVASDGSVFTISYQGDGGDAVVLTAIVVPPSELIIHTQPSPTSVAGQAFTVQPVIYEVDQYGNLETGDDSTVITATLASGTGPLQGTVAVTVKGGVATFTALVDDAAGTITLAFTGDHLTSAPSDSIAISPAGASALVIQTQPSATATAGQALATPPVIDEVDRYGNLETGDQTTVITAAPSAGSAQLAGATATVKGGVATFTNLAVDTAGTIALDFTGDGLTVGPSNSLVVSPAAASQLLIHTQPSATATAGQALATQPVLFEEDRFGNLETGDQTTVITAAPSAGSAQLAGVTATVTGGVATFTALAIDTAGTLALNFARGGLTAGPSNSIAVSPAAASRLVIRTQPSATAIAGQPFATQPVIAEEDAYGNLETGDNGTVVTAALAGGAGPLRGTTTATVMGGVASFAGLADDRAESISLKFTSGNLAAVTSDAIVVGPAAVSELVIRTQPSPTSTAGQPIPIQPVIAEEDAYGNVEMGDNSTVITAAPSAGSAQLTGTTATAKGGVVTFTALADDTAGTTAFTFSGGGLTAGPSSNLKVSPAAPSQLIIHTQPSATATAGQALSTQPVIYEEDRYGNLETGDQSTVITAGPSAGSARLVGATVTVSGGMATFTDLAVDTAGTIALDFSGGGLSVGPSNSIVVAPAAASRLVVGTQPSANATAGETFAAQPVVDEEDSYGNVETSDNSTVVTASLARGAGPLLGTATVKVTGGVATFSGLADDVAGVIALDFTSGSLTAATSTAIAISPAAAHALVIHAQPSATATAGQALGSEPVIYEEDAYGNLETADNTTAITASASAGSARIAGATATVVGGVATFANLAVDTAGTIALKFSGGGLTSAPSVAITVNPAAASQLVIHDQPSATATAGQPLASQPVLYEEDQYGNLETNDDTTVITASLAGGAGPLQGLTTATAVGGVATFSGLADDTSGTFALEFTSGDLTPATSDAIAVGPAAASQLVVRTQPPATAVAGQPFATPTVIDEEDRYGNLETGDDTTVVMVSLAGGAGPLRGTMAASVVGGVAAFTDLADNAAGIITLRLTSGNLAAATTGTITITPTAATHLVVTTPPPAVISAGAAFGFVAEAEDPFGNVATSFGGPVTAGLASGPGGAGLGGTLTVTASGGVATFTDLSLGKAAAGYTIRATSAGLTPATSSAITVAPGAAAQLVVAAEPPSSVTAGTPFGLAVTAEDGLGNVAVSFGGIVALTLASGPVGGILGGSQAVNAVDGVATLSGLTLNRAGSGYTIRASGTGLQPATTTVIAVTPGVPQLVITSEPPASVVAGAPFGLTVTAEDGLGNVIPTFRGAFTLALANDVGGAVLSGTLNATASDGVVTFSGLSLDKSGAGDTIRVTSSGLAPATTSAVGVTPGLAAHLIIAAQPPSTVVAGAPFGVAVTAEDRLGNVATSFNGPVSVAPAGGPDASALGGPQVVDAVAGVASFAGLTLVKAGAGYTLSLSSTGLTGAATQAFIVVPGVASQLVVTSQPQTVVAAGSELSLVVAAEDAYGNVDPDFGGIVTVALSANPVQGTLEGPTTVAAVHGAASFALSLNNAGDGYRLAASSPGLAAVLTNPIYVTPMGSNSGQVGSGGTRPPASLIITGEQVLTARHRGQHRASGFELNFSGALGPSVVLNPANFTLSQFVKRRRKTISRAVVLRSVLTPSPNGVTLLLSGRPRFAQGGQIVVNSPSSAPITDSRGDPLGGRTVFTILPKARGVE